MATFIASISVVVKLDFVYKVDHYLMCISFSKFVQREPSRG